MPRKSIFTFEELKINQKKQLLVYKNQRRLVIDIFKGKQTELEINEIGKKFGEFLLSSKKSILVSLAEKTDLKNLQAYKDEKLDVLKAQVVDGKYLFIVEDKSRNLTIRKFENFEIIEEYIDFFEESLFRVDIFVDQNKNIRFSEVYKDNKLYTKDIPLNKLI